VLYYAREGVWELRMVRGAIPCIDSQAALDRLCLRCAIRRERSVAKVWDWSSIPKLSFVVHQRMKGTYSCCGAAFLGSWRSS
jgi:hypothetical protein